MEQPISIIDPCAALQTYVESYQFINIKGDNASSVVREDYPRTALDMVFTFDGSIHIKSKDKRDIKLSKYALVGLIDKRYEIKFSENITAIHVRFKPNGIYPLTKISLNQSWLQQISLDHLLGQEIDTLYDRIGTESNTINKVSLIEQFLIEKYASANNIHHKFNHCLDLIGNTKCSISVAQLAAAVNSNYKSLDRWFQKYVGTSPKKYLQLNRFKNILNQIENQQQVDWMNLVVDYGFHDQAHFIHQFKAIAERTPLAYLQNRASTLYS